MAALRSLAPDIEIASWRREHQRRLRNNHVCSGCGLDRDQCCCRDDTYVPTATDDDTESAT